MHTCVDITLFTYPQNEAPHLALVAGAFAGGVEGFVTYPFECELAQTIVRWNGRITD